MRYALLITIAACATEDPVVPDAGADADITIQPGTEYWPCFAWPGDVTKCAPKCANHSLLGRFGWGQCEYAPGATCDAENMSGPAYDSSSGCCVPQGTRVDWVQCL